MRVAVLGSTGSIGVSTLDVLGRHPDRFTVEVLAAATNDARLLEQCVRHRPRIAVLQSVVAAERLGLFKLIPGRLGQMVTLVGPDVPPGPRLPGGRPAVAYCPSRTSCASPV